MIRMTGKEMKAYAKRVGLKIRSGAVAALLSSSGKRVQSPIKTISGIPDDAQGWFDPSINRFDASTPKTTLKVTFEGSTDPDEEKMELIRRAELKGRKPKKSHDYYSTSGRGGVSTSSCGSGLGSSC